MANENNLDLNPQAAADSALGADKPQTTGDVKVVRTRKTPKPLVEGINSPVPQLVPETEAPGADSSKDSLAPAPNVMSPKVTLTEAEKVLVSSQTISAEPVVQPPQPVIKPEPVQAIKPQKKAIFPEDFTGQKIVLPGKKHKGNKLVWGILITLLIVSLVFGALLWYDNQTGADISSLWKNWTGNKNQVAQTPETKPMPVEPQNITPAEATTTQPTASTTVPSQVPPKVTQLQVSSTPTGYLNVRSQPSTTGKLLTRVHPGEVYTFTEVQNSWYKITLKDGSSGWVTGQYIKIVPVK